MSQQVMKLDISVLRPHPRNDEFFSNVEGEEFNRLKESIKELGILTPLRVAKDMTIISGHQRYRAAQELGLEDLPVIVDETLKDDDEKVVQLIAANFGRMKNDPVKQGRWIAEYERLRGVRQGSARQKVDQHNVGQVSQEDIARELGVTTITLQRLKSLNTLLPELQDIISEGRISATTGFKLIARLSEEEQHDLLAMLPEATKKFTQAEVQKYVDHIRGLEDENASLEAGKKAAEEEAEKWKEDAVAATKAVKEGTDPSRYMEMKDAKDAAEEKYRTEHEEFVKYRKDMAKQSIEWEKKLKEAETKASRISEAVEVEVYPDDYEELQDYKEKYIELTKRMCNRSDVTDFTAGASGAKSFYLRFENSVGGFLSEFRGLLDEKHQLSKMSTNDQKRFADDLEEIVAIACEMLEELNHTKEVA